MLPGPCNKPPPIEVCNAIDEVIANGSFWHIAAIRLSLQTSAFGCNADNAGFKEDGKTPNLKHYKPGDFFVFAALLFELQ